MIMRAPTYKMEPRAEMMRKLAGNTKGADILDVGCGICLVSEGLEGSVTTVDILDGADVKHDLNEPLPFKDSSFDIILAGEITEHLTNPKGFLLECYRVLRKNGKLVLSVPNICYLRNRVLLLFGKFPQSGAKANLKEEWDDHYSDYNIDFLRMVLSEAGFEVKKIRTNGVFIREKRIPLLSNFAGLGESLIALSVKRG